VGWSSDFKDRVQLWSAAEDTLKSLLKKQIWRDAGHPEKQKYVVKDSISEVPLWAWNSPHWVVERYFRATETESSLWNLTILGDELELVRFTANSQKDYEQGRFDHWDFKQVDNELRKKSEGFDNRVPSIGSIEDQRSLSAR
jgi:hypothetical protein